MINQRFFNGLRVAVVFMLMPQQLVYAAEFTGRFSMLGATAQAEEDDIGYHSTAGDTLTADQQSVRLMLDDVLEKGEWSLHLRGVRRHLSGYPAAEFHSSYLFRYYRGSGNWLDEREGDTATSAGYELDRFVYRHRYERLTIGVGRQAIDWGSGRFWQPLNIFGAFAPTDLDTDYKPGIDALVLEGFPGRFSTLTGAYVLAPEDEPNLEDSGGLYYRRQVGELSELSLLAGSVIGSRVVGGGFESALGGMGWRVEGLYYALEQPDDEAVFWIAGIDYQFTDGTLVVAEWYDNSRGATAEAALEKSLADPLVVYGLQQHLGRSLLGLTVERDITPLLHGGYTLLASAINDDERLRASLLHQLSLSYSVSNESDLLLSLQYGTGRGLDSAGVLRSEFGHLPASMTLRLRFYF